MLWSYWWYSVGAFAIWDHAVNHDVHDLGLAVICFVIGTGQRVVSKIEAKK